MKEQEKKRRSVSVRDKNNLNQIIQDEVIEINEDRFKSLKFRFTFYKESDFINAEDKVVLSLISGANQRVNKLTEIVSDLLSINKIQPGRLELNSSMYRFNESLMACVDQFRLHYPELMIHVEERALLEVVGDRVRIEQVITNFLLNAVKYSSNNQPINIFIEKDGENLKCSITDEGIGIPINKKPYYYILGRLFKVHENSQNYEDMETGLFISAEIIRQHNGDIGVIDEGNNGTTFWFTLPDTRLLIQTD